mmetsp:Transcript_51057/g.118979  ORF Transcript_51057/g.118979 Transcript_51057/m.118979 type:complete len:271 (+) Transcript_51057:594-1406(+)
MEVALRMWYRLGRRVEVEGVHCPVGKLHSAWSMLEALRKNIRDETPSTIRSSARKENNSLRICSIYVACHSVISRLQSHAVCCLWDHQCWILVRVASERLVDDVHTKQLRRLRKATKHLGPEGSPSICEVVLVGVETLESGSCGEGSVVVWPRSLCALAASGQTILAFAIGQSDWHRECRILWNRPERYALTTKSFRQEILMHISQDVDAVGRRLLGQIFHKIQVGLVVYASTWFHARPHDTKSYHIQPCGLHKLKVLSRQRRPGVKAIS